MALARSVASFSRAVLLVVPSLISACDDSDVTQTTPGGAGNGGSPSGVSGSGGGGAAGASGATAAAGTGGSAGAAGRGDAGTMCVVASLQRYCAADACPSLENAPDSLRSSDFGPAQVILQDSCTAVDGSPRIRVVASYSVQLARALIYDATSKQLVGASVYDDLGGCGMPTFDEAIGDLRGFYGEYAPDCGAEWRFDIPDACPPNPADADVGDAGDAGADAGVYECILAH